jgi:exonuclease SbcD
LRLLCTSDWQVGAGAKYGRAAYGPGSRLQDQEQVLARIADLAREGDVDLVIHAGDVLHTRTPSVAEILVAKRALEAMPCPVLVVGGNHDRAGADRPASPEIFENDHIDVSLRPEVIHQAGASIATLPWAPPGTFIAKAGRDGDINAEISAALADVAGELRGQCQPGLPAVLVLHWWVEGATTAHGVGEGVIFEPVIPIDVLRSQGWAAIICGHVHQAQVLSGAQSVFYCGPPTVTDFGEADEAHGVWIVDIDGSDLEHSVTLDFTPLPDRPFVTIEADGDALSTAGPRVDLCLFDDESEIADAIVRVRYHATADEMRRINQTQIRAVLEDAGAWRVFVEPIIERADDGVDEQLDPLEALYLWCEANEVETGAREQLGAYTARLLQEAAA